MSIGSAVKEFQTYRREKGIGMGPRVRGQRQNDDLAGNAGPSAYIVRLGRVASEPLTVRSSHLV